MSRLPAPPRHAARPVPVPLVPDPSVVHDNAMRALSRAAVAIGINALNPSMLPGDYVRRMWPADRDLPMVLKAAISPATTASTPALAAVAQAFLAALLPQSAGAGLLNRGLGIRFDGAASISVPGIALPVADFVAEGEAIPVTEAPTSAAPRLERHKLACIAVATSEMLRSPAAEELIRAVLVEATGPALDRVLFSAGAAAPDRPAGLLFGIAPMPAGANLADSLVGVTSAVAPVAGNGGIAVVTSPTSSIAINLLLPREPPFAVLVASNLAPGTTIAIALNALVSAVEGPPGIDASTDAVVHEETGPMANIGGGVMAKPLRSLFQSDTVGLKLRWPLSWALRSPQGVAWIQG
jgi:hypothetical protein